MNHTGTTPSPDGSTAARAPALGHIVVLAQDLIWATRLLSLLKAAGADGKQAKTLREFEAELPQSDRAIVDLTASSYEPLEAVALAAHQGVDVVCVGQHEDLQMRRRAVAAGATRVWTYNQVHGHGPTLVGRWLTAADGDR
jgi:hypothetical protein